MLGELQEAQTLSEGATVVIPTNAYLATKNCISLVRREGWGDSQGKLKKR